jgi:tripartite-type tricarboxylate transporter receptor subunit TctC
MRRRELIAAATAAAALPLSSFASQWPERAIKLVVPYPPGATTDTIARLVGQKVADALGKPVVIENKGGASGIIGSDFVAKAPADGYTLLLGNVATHGASPHMVPNAPYHPVRDFTPLALACTNPIVLAVHPSVPAKNVAELVAWAQANPDKANYGHSGTGSPHHLVGELLKLRTGVPFTPIAYRGGSPAVQDAMSGQIQMVVSSAVSVLPHIRSGKLRAIAMADARFDDLPDVPTIAETLPGFEMSTWLAFFGPAKLPAPIARRLSEEMVKALRDPAVIKTLDEAGLEVVGAGPDVLAKAVARDYEARGKLIREAGLAPK